MRSALGYSTARNFEGWIPPSDISDTTVKDGILATAVNIDYANGKLKSAKAPVQLYTMASYILAYARFTHSVLGECDVWVARGSYAEADPANIIYGIKRLSNGTWYYPAHYGIFQSQGYTIPGVTSVNEDDVTLCINGDEIYVSVALKATLPMATRTVWYSVQLRYQEAVIDGAFGKSTYNVSPGWYIYPRWGQVAYNHYALEDTEKFTFVFSNAVLCTQTPTNSIIKDTPYGVGNPANTIFNAINDSLVSVDGLTITKSTAYYNNYAITIENKQYGKFRLGKFLGLSKASFNLSYIKPDNSTLSMQVRLVLTDSTGVIVREQIETMTNRKVHGYTKHIITFDELLDGHYLEVKFDVLRENMSPVPGAPLENVTIYLSEIELTGYSADRLALLAVNRDGSRYKIKENFHSLNCFPIFASKIYYRTIKEFFDYRVSKLELYLELIEDAPLRCVGYFSIFNTYRTLEIGLWIASELSFTSNQSVNITEILTMNFSYGLGSTVYADQDHKVIDEVVYAGRTYIVSEDNKVYHSHISGYGKHWAMCFPYSEEFGYGYFQLESFDKARGLAVTSSNDLLVISDKNAYLYFVQSGSSNIPMKSLRLLQAGKGMNKKALLKNDSGKPQSEVICWANPSGVYIYAGGNEMPKDITEDKLKNYMLSRTIRRIGYNEIKDELLLYLTTGIVIAYELYADRFKEYSFAFTPKIVNGRYVVDTTNKLYDVSSGTLPMQATIKLHDNAETIIDTQGNFIKLSVDTIKVLHDMHLTGQFYEGAFVSVKIYNGSTLLYTMTPVKPVNLIDNFFLKLLAKIGTIYRKLGVELIFTGPFELTEVTYRFGATFRSLGQMQ